MENRESIKILSKEEFNKLSIEDQFNYLNTLLIDCKTLRKLEEVSGIPRSTVKDRATKYNYQYNKKLYKYVSNIEEHGAEGTSERTSPEVKTAKDTTRQDINNMSLKSLYKLIQDQQKEINSIKDIIKDNVINKSNNDNTVNTDNTGNTQNTDNIKILDNVLINSLDLIRGDGESVSRSVRINKEVWNNFKALTRRHMDHNINASDIITLALYEFVEKYK